MAIASNFPAIKPSLLLDFANTKKLDPRITFTRTTTATYYDGVTTAKAEENLLLQSQDFATTWGNVSTTETVDSVAAPDGTTTADTITATAGLSSHSVFQTVTVPTGTIVVSVFAKAGTHNYIQLFLSTQTGTYANFDLTAGAGATGTSSGVVSTSITSVGNDWYRCVMIFTQSNATAVQIALVSSSSAARADSWTALGTETVYLWGAQLEQRSSVTSYTATTTQPITNYIPVLLTAASGVARLDHNPTTDEPPELLIEEARTNLLTYSADFSNAAWIKVRSSITSNTIVAPDGTLTGDKLVEDTTASNTHFIDQSPLTLTAVPFTWSVYLKAGERIWARLTLLDGVATHSAYVNLSNGSLGSLSAGVTATITSVGNGWYRCSLTVTTAATATGAARVTLATNDGSTTIYTGNGYSGLFLWGAQLEAGAFATSYIATTAATVTRNADTASMTGSNFTSWFNAGEGTIYTEHNERAFNQSHQIVWLDSQNIDERINFNVSSSNTLNVQVVSNGSDSFAGDTPTLTSGNYKIAFAYATNNAGVSVNGSSVTTDTSVTLPIGVNRLFVGSTSFGTSYLNSRIKKIAYYPLRLTDAQLQALTS